MMIKTSTLQHHNTSQPEMLPAGELKHRELEPLRHGPGWRTQTFKYISIQKSLIFIEKTKYCQMK